MRIPPSPRRGHPGAQTKNPVLHAWMAPRLGEQGSAAQSEVESQIAAAGTPQGFKTLLQDDQSAYSKLVAVAPSDIQADAQTLQASFNKIIAFFAKYHYDIRQAVPHIQELNGLINSPKLKAAENRIKAWGDSNC